MARTWWSVIAAVVLMGLSVAVFFGRRHMLGAEIDAVRGAATWQITFIAAGELEERDATVTLLPPPDFRHQHILDRRLQSRELLIPMGRTKDISRREIVLRRASGSGRQPFRLTYGFESVLPLRPPTPAMVRRAHELDAAPTGQAYLRPSPGIESENKEIRRQADDVIGDVESPRDRVQALFDFVDRLENEPAIGRTTALGCLRNEAGDPAGKSRLLVALCRSLSIPARPIGGLILTEPQQQNLHYWAEAWVDGHWLPMCPTYHHFGQRHFPTNYLVIQIGDWEVAKIRGGRMESGFVARELHDLSSATEEPPSPGQLVWMHFSFHALRPAEQHLVRFLLLLPVSALIVSFFRTVIGVTTFGTFSPALLGLAFLDVKALPWGLGIFVLTVLVGWGLRKLIDHLHLLLVPRTSVLLTLIIVFLIILIVIASRYGIATTQYISLFPLVILTHMVERFWTVEEEDGTAASFKTLFGTLLVAGCISVALSPHAVSNWMFLHPETLGLVLAAQLLLGRYTGYRLAELYRFRDLLKETNEAASDFKREPEP